MEDHAADNTPTAAVGKTVHDVAQLRKRFEAITLETPVEEMQIEAKEDAAQLEKRVILVDAKARVTEEVDDEVSDADAPAEGTQENVQEDVPKKKGRSGDLRFNLIIDDLNNGKDFNEATWVNDFLDWKEDDDPEFGICKRCGDYGLVDFLCTKCEGAHYVPLLPFLGEQCLRKLEERGVKKRHVVSRTIRNWKRNGLKKALKKTKTLEFASSFHFRAYQKLYYLAGRYPTEKAIRYNAKNVWD